MEKIVEMLGYCISRNFRGKIFSGIWLKQTFRESLFLQLFKRSCNLHIVDHRVSLSMLPNNYYWHFRMKSPLEMVQTNFFQFTRQEYVCYTSIKEYSPNRDICWDIDLHHMLISSFWLPQMYWQILQILQFCMFTCCTQYLHHWRCKLFCLLMNGGNIFCEFLCSFFWFNSQNLRKYKLNEISIYTVIFALLSLLANGFGPSSDNPLM